MTLNSFFFWFYYGLGGLGGWLIFFALALIAVIWILYDSGRRRIPAPGWKLGVILAALLLLPAIVFRFGEAAELLPYSETIFYLGLLGGVLPVVLAVGYYVAFQGMVGCPNGHVYEAVLGACPYEQSAESEPETGDEPVGDDTGPTVIEGDGLGSRRSKAAAWLVTRDGRQHQLYKGATRIGRSAARNDIVFDDPMVGREHAKITEERGVFRLVDLGSANHTYVNDERVREATLLEPDDRIQFGRKTVVDFVTTHR